MSNLFFNQRLYKKNIDLLKKGLYCFKDVKNYLFKTNNEISHGETLKG